MPVPPKILFFPWPHELFEERLYHLDRRLLSHMSYRTAKALQAQTYCSSVSSPAAREIPGKLRRIGHGRPSESTDLSAGSHQAVSGLIAPRDYHTYTSGYMTADETETYPSRAGAARGATGGEPEAPNMPLSVKAYGYPICNPRSNEVVTIM